MLRFFEEPILSDTCYPGPDGSLIRGPLSGQVTARCRVCGTAVPVQRDRLCTLYRHLDTDNPSFGCPPRREERELEIQRHFENIGGDGPNPSSSFSLWAWLRMEASKGRGGHPGPMFPNPPWFQRRPIHPDPYIYGNEYLDSDPPRTGRGDSLLTCGDVESNPGPAPSPRTVRVRVRSPSPDARHPHSQAPQHIPMTSASSSATEGTGEVDLAHPTSLRPLPDPPPVPDTHASAGQGPRWSSLLSWDMSDRRLL